MEKVLVYLEKYVQWVALGLGALFLIWMVKSYVLTNPVQESITLAGHPESVSPGNVDVKIAEGPAHDLDLKINTPHPDINISGSGDIGTHVALPTPDTRPTVAVGLSVWTVDPVKFVSNITQPATGAQVSALPQTPALNFVDAEPLRTVILAADASGQAVHQDTNNVTTFWSIPVGALADSFKAAFGTKLLDTQQVAIFARVTLVRQEQTGPNTWGPDEMVQPTFNLPAPPVPYPDANDPQAAQKYDQYRNWLSTPGVEQAILADPFPQVAFADRADLTWKPLEAWIPFRAQQGAAQRADTTAPPAAPTDPTRKPTGTPATAAPRLGGASIGGLGGMIGGNPPAGTTAPPAGATGAPDVAIPPIPKLQPAPVAAFNPASMVAAGDIGVFFHDLSAESGKTYRYKVRYTLVNPVYGLPQRVSDPKLAAQFGIDSPDSAWSAPVQTPPRTHFWCAAKQPQLGQQRAEALAVFNVYSWHDGLWREKDYSIVPGDEVGANEGADGDFVTDWTYLDQRAGGGRGDARFVLVTPDDGGPAQQHDVANDLNSPDFKAFKRDFDAQTKGTAVNPSGPDAAGNNPNS